MLNDYVDAQYGNLDDSECDEGEIKDINYTGVTDVTNLKKDKILSAIRSGTNIMIGSFTMKIIAHVITKNKSSITNLDIHIYESISRTYSGVSCKIDNSFDILSDNRFSNKLWLKYFNPKGKGKGINVPEDVIVNIIIYLKAIQKFSAFV